MDVYINYNFCGYRWFEIENVLEKEAEILLKESSYNEKHSELVRRLMTYDPYDIVFVEDNGELILAIRGIEDKRTDTYNRNHLAIALIFIGNRYDFELFHKIVQTYVSHKGDFDAWLRGTLYCDISDVIFFVKGFLIGLDKIQDEKSLQSKGLGGLAYTSNLCFICSNWSSEKIESLLGIDKRRFLSSMVKLEQIRLTNWIVNPFANIREILEEETLTLEYKVKQLKKNIILYTAIAFVAGVILGYLIL